MRDKLSLKRIMHPMIKLVGLLTICLSLMVGCSMPTSEKDSNLNDQQDQPKSIEVEPIKRNPIVDQREVTADLVASLTTDVTAVTGGKVVELLKQRGDKVKAGELILRLSSPDALFEREKAALALSTVEASIAESRSKTGRQYEELQKQVEELEKNYNRMRNHYDEGLVSQVEVDAASAALMEAKLALRQLEPGGDPSQELSLKSAQMALQKADEAVAQLEVYAPISGVLTEFRAEEGMVVPNGMKIGVIQRLDPVLLIAGLSEEESALVAHKHQLSYRFPDQDLTDTAPVRFLSKVADPKTNMYELNLEVANPDMSLKPGMKVKVQLIDTESLMALTVPTYSIVHEEDEAYVFILSNDIVHKRKIELGRIKEPNQEVLSGIKEGEMLVVSGHQDLVDGETVGQVTVRSAQN